MRNNRFRTAVIIGLLAIFLLPILIFGPFVRVETHVELVGLHEDVPAWGMLLDRHPPIDDLRAELERNPQVINGFVDFEGDTLLGKAAYLGHREAVELLLEMGAHVDGHLAVNPQAPWSRTPLANAVQEEHEYIVMILLDHDADPYLKSPLGLSAYDLLDNVRSPRIRALFSNFPPPGE